MKVTVKTIDAGSEEFDLSDEVTVGGLKQEIVRKMGITLDQQRLIFQGKVLRDEQQLKDLSIDGKVIHLVKRPPPSVTDQPSATPEGEPGGEGEDEVGRRRGSDGVRVQASQDLVIVGNIPVSSHNDITQVTQNIVDQIVNSLSSQGAQARVSAETITTDSTGQTHTTTMTAHSDPNRAERPSQTPPATDIQQQQQQQPQPQPQPSTSRPEATPAAKDPPKEASAAPPTRSRRLADQAEERAAELQRKEAERNLKHQRTILSHARTVRRCLIYATKVLDRYDRAAARIAKRKAGEGSRQGAEGEEEEENWEPMETVEEMQRRGAFDVHMEDKFTELDRSPDDPGNFSASVYARFVDCISELQRRVHPCVVEYKQNIEDNAKMSEDDALMANRVALTVKDFNYYIGHAYVSLSRLHVNMIANPPRNIRLTAPKRTEMRRMMQQMRRERDRERERERNAAPRRRGPGEAPSGYIVDISRDNAPGESTRAIVNREGVGVEVGGSGRGTRGEGGGARGEGQSKEGGAKGEGKGGARGGAGVPRGGPNSRYKTGIPSLGQLLPGMGYENFLRAQREAEGGSQPEGVASHPVEEMEVEESGAKQEARTAEDEEVRSKPSAARPQEVGVSEGVAAQEKGEEPGKEGVAAQEKGEEPGKEGVAAQEKEEGEGDGETPQYLARLLSELITGVADPNGPHRPSNKPKEEEGKGEGSKDTDGAKPAPDSEKPPKATEPEEDGNKEEGEGRRRTFAERYAGPEGTTVTISAAPAPPFGIPGLPAMEGPSLSIKNRGEGTEPEMTINFPMPPALQLLHSLLERAEERHRQRREAGETSSESSSSSDEDEEGAAEKPKKEKKKKEGKRQRAFLEEDGEVKSISDAGSLDSIGSDHEEPPEFENPMTQMAASAMSSMHTGEHVSMMDAMAEVRSHLGAPPDNEDDDDEDLGMVEEILKVVSRELSVVEVMQVFKGEVKAAQRLQPSLFNFIKDKLLAGATPRKSKMQEAIKVFLANCEPALRAVEHEFDLRDPNIDFPASVVETLWQLFEEAYGYIVTEYTEKENEDALFAAMMHQWAIHATSHFSNLIRHAVNNEDEFVVLANKLISTLFPPNTPSLILDMCGDSILKEMQRCRRIFPGTADEMDRYIKWKPGTTPTPNDNYPLRLYSMEFSTTHPRQKLAIPTRESCPGGPGAKVPDKVKPPPGVPEEWVSAIKRDSSALSEGAGPQQPFSEAYLAGMSAKRRKQLDTSEPYSMYPEDLVLQVMEEALINTGVEAINGKTQLEMLSYMHHKACIGQAFANDLYGFERNRFRDNFPTDKYPNITSHYSLLHREMLSQDREPDEPEVEDLD